MAPDPALVRLASPIEEGTKWPRPLCPQCLAGHLRFAAPTKVEHGQSKSAHGHPAWEPEWIHGVFTASAICENPDCGQPAQAIGDYSVNWSQERDHDFDAGPPYSTYYTVRQIHPPLVLMRVPQSTPQSLQEGIERASSVLLADPGLAATALRLVIEQFLSSEGVPATRANGSFVSADDRIKQWRELDPTRNRVADLLLAVKWIGNAGTHRLTNLTVHEVLEGVQFLDEATHVLFIGPDIDARARAVNNARGPALPSS